MGYLFKFLAWVSGGKSAQEMTRIRGRQKSLNDRLDNAVMKSGIMMKVEQE